MLIFHNFIENINLIFKGCSAKRKANSQGNSQRNDQARNRFYNWKSHYQQ